MLMMMIMAIMVIMLMMLIMMMMTTRLDPCGQSGDRPISFDRGPSHLVKILNPHTDHHHHPKDDHGQHHHHHQHVYGGQGFDGDTGDGLEANYM